MQTTNKKVNFRTGLESSKLLIPADWRATSSLSTFNRLTKYITATSPETGKIAKIIFGRDSNVRYTKILTDFPSPSRRSSIRIDLLLQYIKVRISEKKQKKTTNLDRIYISNRFNQVLPHDNS